MAPGMLTAASSPGKRNTSRPVFTAHERALAQSAWTESSARLNCDSFLPFGSCSLCLEVARDPVACPKGDVFCRECALANILAQKKELKRAEKARKALSEEDARKAAAEDEEDRARAIRDFEMTQAGLEVKLTARMSFQETAPQKGAATDTQRPKLLTDGQHTNDQLIVADKGANGTKRKFALDEHEVDANEKNDKAKARKAIEDEKVRLYREKYLLYCYSISDF